jgi:hypothetical protein
MQQPAGRDQCGVQLNQCAAALVRLVLCVVRGVQDYQNRSQLHIRGNTISCAPVLLVLWVVQGQCLLVLTADACMTTPCTALPDAPVLLVLCVVQDLAEQRHHCVIVAHKLLLSTVRNTGQRRQRTLLQSAAAAAAAAVYLDCTIFPDSRHVTTAS